MVLYRRNFLPGGTYFFTVTLRDRRSSLLTDHIGLLRDAFRQVMLRTPFSVEAAVVLPEHLHTIWTLPAGDARYPHRWRAIKSRFGQALHHEGIAIPRMSDGSLELWQKRYWEHTIRDERDLAAHVDYIHFNPVKHGLVEQVCDWPYSSFHRFVKDGRLPEDWGGMALDLSATVGETP